MQTSLLVLAVCVGVYYFVVYLPLSRRLAEMSPPAGVSWRNPVPEGGVATPPDVAATDGRDIDLEALRAMERKVQELSRVVEARIAPDAVTRARMSEPFQLIEFQNERQTRLEELSQLAQAEKVELGPMVAAGFPEHMAEHAYPELLWPQLQLSYMLVYGAIQSGVSTVGVVRLQPVQWHRGASGEREWLAELPAEVELAGSAAAVLRFLERLPLRAGEIKTRGLPEAPATKPVLFIRGLLLRKEGRESPDRVRLELTATTFVRLERPAG